jgi:AbrB family looped-hinge helix DNA binding protein
MTVVFSGVCPAPYAIVESYIRKIRKTQFAMDGLHPHYPGDCSMTLVKVRRAAQITLPRAIRDAAHLAEGDYLEAELTSEGILLRPMQIAGREPSPEQEAEILAVVDEERKAYAAERRR